MTFTFEQEENLIQAYHIAVVMRREAEKTSDFNLYIQAAQEFEKIGLNLVADRVRERAEYYRRVGHG